MMDAQRWILYAALAFLSLILYQTWMLDYHPPATTEQTQAQGAAVDASGAPAPVSDSGASSTGQGAAATGSSMPLAADLPGAVGGASTVAAAPEAVAPITNAVVVTTDVMDVRIDPVGATIIGVELPDYPVAVDQPDTPFTLMSNQPAHFLVAESGLQSRAGQPAPTHYEQMTVAPGDYRMADGQDTVQVPFSWTSPDGVKVTKTLTFTRGSYEVAVDYLVENGSTEDWTAHQYRQLKRKPGTKDEKQQFVNTYIGAVVSNEEDRYTKVTFGDMEDERLDVDVTDGWVAMIQHYFASAWIPVPGEKNSAYTVYLGDENRYLIGMVSGAQTIPAGGEGHFATKAFIGPKIKDKLAVAAPHLELTIDLGWLTIIAKPLFWLLKTIHGFLGNWGFAIIGVTLVVKAIFYKLSEASYRSMARMKKLQPKLTALKERHGDDRSAMGQATMELYKKEKVNPLGGCLPMIIQIPVFIALYWTLLESVELRQAPWILWIKDLSIRDPYFILPVLMAGTMFFQQKLNPAPADPIQAKVFQFLPLIFGVFFAFFPAGLVLYWVVNNSLGMAQQYYITRHVLAEKPSKKKTKEKAKETG